jgi:hypothetical protein
MVSTSLNSLSRLLQNHTSGQPIEVQEAKTQRFMSLQKKPNVIALAKNNFESKLPKISRNSKSVKLDPLC